MCTWACTRKDPTVPCRAGRWRDQDRGRRRTDRRKAGLLADLPVSVLDGLGDVGNGERAA